MSPVHRDPGTPTQGRIPLVDDNPDNIEVVAARLRFRGHEVEAASRGRSALERVRERPPDLILLDVMLPDISGYEVARRIKHDAFGHQAGDRVLQQLARILRQSAREIDKLGRYRGEEFLTVLPDTDVDDGAIFLERVRRAVGQHCFAIGTPEPLAMTVSAGVASYPHRGVQEPETLIRFADEALHAAKAAGRNRVVQHGQVEVGSPKQG
ncbi:MAG: diguanylate cyclase [Gemmatimonadetes bacterium]|nr:diguanylate cyclase [Gemmatimonadota bacterium]